MFGLDISVWAIFLLQRHNKSTKQLPISWILGFDADLITFVQFSKQLKDVAAGLGILTLNRVRR